VVIRVPRAEREACSALGIELLRPFRVSSSSVLAPWVRCEHCVLPWARILALHTKHLAVQESS